MSIPRYLSVQHFFWGVMLLLMFILQFYHSELFELLRYDRHGIAVGEYWRLASGHFVHLSWGHCWLNLAGCVLFLTLFGKYFSIGVFLLATVLSITVIDIGLFTLKTNIEWYVGFSGALHGLIMTGLLFAIKTDNHPSPKWLLLLLVCKLVWEMFSGSLPGSADVTGGKVIVEAHFYGALGGLLSFLIVMLAEKLNVLVDKHHIAHNE